MKKNIRASLAAASCALIGSNIAVAENTLDVGDWDISAALLFYNEADRVSALEPVIKVTKQLDTDESVSVKLTLDSLTGASASGAVPTNRPQTFTRPSGKGSYDIQANEAALDDSFKDSRGAVNVGWEKPIDKDLTMNLGANISKEYDYNSLAANASFAKDLNGGNTTVSAGLSLGVDAIDAVGGKPIAFAEMTPEDTTQARDKSSDSKTLVDVIVGVTQVIDQNSLFQVNYSISQASGYLTDPYKLISVVDPITGVPLFQNGAEPNLPTVLFENRPDSRLKHSLYGQYKRYISGDVLDASYRFMIDDWGINSHTVDLNYRWQLNDRHFLRPHFRLYQPGEADFYTPFFVDGSQPTAGNDKVEASADFRLSEFTAYTLGLEYGQENASNSWRVALEYYLQTGDQPAEAFGELRNQDLHPDLEAVMLRVIYDF
ncbi:MAG: DUF3570 domain-containing protein [Spongiibacteraceae bacterium]